jgi:hypothetical protein
MIVRQELKDWFLNPSAQGATRERVRRVGAEMKAHAGALSLSARLDEAPREAGAILAIARDQLLVSAMVDDIMRRLARESREDPFFRPPLRHSATDLVSGLWVYEHPSLSLFLATASADALLRKRARRNGGASIAFTGQRSVYRFIRAGGAILSLWATDPIDEGFSGTTATRCRLVERRKVEEGETVEIDGRERGFVIDSATSDIVYVQAITPVGAGPLMVEFDADTHRFVGASSTDEASSRTQLMLSLLRTMERADAAPTFVKLLGSPHFYARWQTMREFLALDAEAALPHLNRMAQSDPHPEVRAAAAAALQFVATEQQEPIACHA